MGVLGGLIRFEDAKSFRPISSICCCCKQSDSWSGTAQDWAHVVDWESLLLSITFVVIGFSEVLMKDIGSSLWFQLAVPYSQLTIVYGLSMDNGLSYTSKILRSDVGVFFWYD